jgi:outer membrane receptor protein involved in Fe transport
MGTRLSGRTGERDASSVSTVDRRAASPGPAQSAEALARLPGVSLTNDQGTRAQPTLELRGFTLSPVTGMPQGVSVFLDGVRINEPDAQELNFDLVPMDAVVRAEVVRGPTAVFGKNTLAGAVNLTTLRGSAEPHLEAGTDAGAFGYSGAHLLMAGARDGYDGMLLARASSGGGYQARSSATARQLFTTIGHRAGGSDLALSVLYANDRIYEAGSLPESWLAVDRRANYSVGDFFSPELLHVALRGNDSLGRAELRGNLFARSMRAEQFNANAGAPNTRAFVGNASLGGALESSISTSLARLPLLITIGGEATHSRVRYRVLDEPSASAPDIPGDCDAATGECENARVNGDDAGLYVQGALQLTPRTTLIASARGDWVRIPFRDLRAPDDDGTNTFWRVSPRVGLTYTASDALTLYGSFGSGFRAPAALELACASPTAPCPLPFSLGADPPLRPVGAWNTELGASVTPLASTHLHASVFRTTVRDEIVFVSSQTTAGYFQNVARTERDGAELSADYAAPGNTTLSASYAYLRAEYRTPATLESALDNNDVTPGDRFPLTPAHVASAQIAHVHALRSMVLTGVLAARGVSSQFLRGDEANRMSPIPGYGVLDARLSLESTHLAVEAHMGNVLNHRYVVYGAYAENGKGAIGSMAPTEPVVERFLTPALPRNLTVSVTLRR